MSPPSSGIETGSNIKVGTGPDSWGVWFADDPKQIPWQRYLDEVVEAGYEWTELGPYGYLPTDPVSLRKELESRQLKLAGAFVINHLEDPSLFSQLEQQATEAGELVAALGAKFLVLIDATYTNMSGERTLPIRLESDGWKRLLETTQKLAESTSSRLGLQLVFHPHADSHVEYPEQVEEFLDQTDPVVGLCLDTGHYSYRGGDPVDLVRRRHERILYLHVKTVRDEVRARVEAERIPFVTAVGMDMFCELPEGVVDFVALTKVLGEVGFDGHGIVEQDMYPAPFDKPLPIAKRTRRYLRDIGFG
jgi:inosose dehydratase